LQRPAGRAAIERGGGVGSGGVGQSPSRHPPPSVYFAESIHRRTCRKHLKEASMIHPTLSHRIETKTVKDIENLYEAGLLNLEPGFQRQSVWSERDRARLIDSILRNYPVPAIFLYRREDDGQIIYDVIDGKQRIESVLMFMGLMRGRYGLKAQLQGHDEIEWIDWKRLCKRKLQPLITGYRIPVIEVDGEMGDIIDLFVRINSTGKALTPQEKRRAKYYNSPFLKEADWLARRYEWYFTKAQILSAGQISRMKHVELVCELMLSIHQGDVINKKAALDRVMKTGGFNARDISKASRKTTTALNRVRRMFPKLYSTRFSKVTDFYSLARLVSKFEDEGMILTDRKRNSLAWDLLVTFSNKVDDLRERQRKLETIKPEQEVYRHYLHTVLQATDEYNQRKARENILRGILGSLFAKKDSQRGFTSEQRRLLWNTASGRRCESCKKVLSWNDFTLDHIDPHSKGGRSRLENAALMCRSCNSSKGNRRRL
jgi:5-methylcytosine-specific restriction endonuclease McrA